MRRQPVISRVKTQGAFQKDHKKEGKEGSGVVGEVETLNKASTFGFGRKKEGIYAFFQANSEAKCA